MAFTAPKRLHDNAIEKGGLIVQGDRAKSSESDPVPVNHCVFEPLPASGSSFTSYGNHGVDMQGWCNSEKGSWTFEAIFQSSPFVVGRSARVRMS